MRMCFSSRLWDAYKVGDVKFLWGWISNRWIEIYLFVLRDCWCRPFTMVWCNQCRCQEFSCGDIVQADGEWTKFSKSWSSLQTLSTDFDYRNNQNLTHSTPTIPKCCCSKGSVPYWSNAQFLIFDIQVLWRSVLSARAPECQKLKIVG